MKKTNLNFKKVSKDRLEKIEKINKLRKEIRDSGLMDDYISN
jgi:hypothetical protein